MVVREHRPWLWASTSTVVIALGLYILATLPRTYGEARRYEMASRCSGAGSEPPRCLEVVDGVVEQVYSRRGRRTTDHFVDVRVGERATFPPVRQPKTVEIEDTFGDPQDDAADGVYDRLRAGDRVRLGYWGRQLARVTKPTVGSVETIASPVFGSSVSLRLGPLLPLLGALGWWGAVALRRRSGSWSEKASFDNRRRSVPAVLGIGAIFGVTILVVLVGDAVGTDTAMMMILWVMGAAGGAVVAGLLCLIGALVRRLRD